MASKARSVLIESRSGPDESQQGAVAAGSGAQMLPARRTPVAHLLRFSGAGSDPEQISLGHDAPKV